MDSPVIVDNASKFGRNLDLGFPFDDEGFGRRSDIRSHLDDLAARHPEFADHLLGPAWGDIPFTGSLRNRRRGSSNNHHQSNNQDEDTRSQASGSSATSAASGASGVSSHGEPEQLYQQHQQQQQQEPTTSTTSTNNTKIPQYGLRNTVDIGQHRHNIMNQDRDNRGQRSMSAPPENRQGNDEQQIPSSNQNQQNNQRFVSRVDITPQINPLTGDKINQSSQQSQIPHPQQQQSPPQSQQSNQKSSSSSSSSSPQQSNVRHIPIFVEGRDTPVIPKNIDETIYHHHQPSPPRYHRDNTQYDIPPEFHSPPHFQRPSHFNQHYVGKHNPWSGFQDQFSRDTFDHPGIRKTTQQTNNPPTTGYRQQPSSATQNKFNNNNNNTNDNNNKTYKKTKQEQDDNDVLSTEPPIRKQTVPIDALEKVSLVQNEVDSLTEQVKLWNGNTRKDKQYIYLDEMLTRELIKLDDIDTEGKENVRQARKNAIKCIQDSISLLESKAPIGGVGVGVVIGGDKKIDEICDQQQQQEQQQQPMDIQIPEVEKVQNNVEKMEIEKKSEDEDVVNKAIPLPPGPTSLSPVQLTTDKLIESDNNNLQNKIDENIKNDDNNDNKMIVDPNIAIPLEAAPIIPVVKMDVQSNKLLNNNNTDNKSNNEKNKNNDDDKKTIKKMKKIKKQTPISTEPIPLPAPETHQT